MNRREFIHSPALTGAFAALYTDPSAAAEARRSGVAGHVTMSALASDCVRLAMCSRAIPTATKDLMAKNLDLVRIGGLVQVPVNRIPELLDSTRGRKTGDREQALVFGSLIERAAAQFKPALRTDPECDLYRDVFLLRELAQTPATPAAAGDIYDLLLTLETRRLIGVHTFSPDAADIDAWLANLIRWRRDCRALFKRYANVFCSPVPELTRKHLDGFYGRDDPLIQFARAVQGGTLISRPEFEAALESAPSPSQYAKALRKGHDYLAAASAYMQRSTNASTLIRLLNGQ